MSADGTWNLMLQTPMGPQKGVLTLTTDSGSLGGTLSTSMGNLPLTDGTVDGDHLTWKAKMTAPMPMDLAFAASISGDAISGTVKMGPMGESAFEGTRGSHGPQSPPATEGA